MIDYFSNRLPLHRNGSLTVRQIAQQRWNSNDWQINILFVESNDSSHWFCKHRQSQETLRHRSCREHVGARRQAQDIALDSAMIRAGVIGNVFMRTPTAL